MEELQLMKGVGLISHIIDAQLQMNLNGWHWDEIMKTWIYHIFRSPLSFFQLSSEEYKDNFFFKFCSS